MHFFSKPVVKIVLWSFLSFLLCLMIGISFIPSVVSSPWGQKKITKFINTNIPGTLKADQISVSWSGNQMVQGIEVTDPNGQTVLTADQIVLNAPLFSLLFGSKAVNSLELKNFEAILQKETNGFSNWENAFGLNRSSTPSSSSILLEEPIAIRNLNVHADLGSTEQAIFFKIHGFTKQGAKEGEINASAHINGIEKTNLSGLFNFFCLIGEGKKIPDVESSIQIDRFPTAILDQLGAIFQPNPPLKFREAFGSELNLHMDSTIKSHVFSTNLVLKTPKIQGEFAGKLADGKFHTDRPSVFHWSLSPEFVNSLLKNSNSPLALIQPTRLQLTVEQLSFPFDWHNCHHFSLEELHFKSQARMEHIDLQPKDSIDSLQIEDFNVSLDSEEGSPTFTFLIQGAASHGKENFKIDLKSTINTPSSADQLLHSMQEYTNIIVEGNTIPVKLIDDLAQMNGWLLDALGSQLNFTAKIKNEGSSGFSADLVLDTELISIPTLPIRLGKQQLEIVEKSVIDYKLSTPLLQRLSLEKALHLSEEVPIRLILNHIFIPFFPKENSYTMNWQKLHIDAEMNSEPMKLLNTPALGDFHVSEVKMQIAGKPSAQIIANAEAQIQSLNQSGFTPEVLGGIAKIHFSSNAIFNEKGQFEIPHFLLDFSSEAASGNLEGKWNFDQTFSLTKNGTFKYTVTPAALRDLGIAKENQPTLLTPTTLRFSLEPFSFSLQEEGVENLVLKGLIRFKELNIGMRQNATASLFDFEMPWNLNGPKNLLSLELNGKTSDMAAGTTGGIQGNIEIKNWLTKNSPLFSKAQIVSNLEFNQIPTTLMSAFSGAFDLTALLGDAFNAQLLANHNLENTENGLLSLHISSPLLKGKMDLNLGKAITLSENQPPAEFQWVLTPKGFQNLRNALSDVENANGLNLTQNSTVRLMISSLDLPLDSKSWVFGRMNAHLIVDRLTVLEDNAPEPVSFSQIRTHINSESFAKAIQFQLDALESQSELSLVGSLQNALDREGKFNLNEMILHVNSKVKSLPIGVLANLFLLNVDMQNRINAVIGNRLDANVQVQLRRMNGPVSAHFYGSNGNAVLNAHLNQGILVLNEPFTAEVKVTPELGKAVLKDIVPFLANTIGSDEPIRVTIYPEGFYLPLNPFDFSKTQVPYITLELGKIAFAKEGDLGTLLELLKSSTNELSVWFTPLYVHLNAGEFTFERLDLLINQKYPLAAWGKVDLIRDKVRMTMGLTAKALAQAFDLKLSKDYMLQIPVKGSTSNVKIDKAKATTRISALLAQSQGGVKGKIFGTVLELATNDGKDGIPPPPTTNPLPWDVGPGNEEENGYTQETPSPKEFNPIKEVKKGAKNVLKQIFR